MIKAAKLIKELTNNHTQPLPKKYVEVVLKVATLEERMRTFTSLGMIDKTNDLNNKLSILIEQLKIDFKNEQLGNDKKDD